MADSTDNCSKIGCSQRFKKLYSIELGKHITVGQLYRGLELHMFDGEQEDQVQLSLAMDRQGKSRGLAFLRIPIVLEKHVLGCDGRLLKGEKLRIKEEKRKGARLLKKMRWVRDYKTTTAATVCLNQPLHHDCYQDKTDPEIDEEFSEPVFDVGARLFHREFEDDLDTVLAKAYTHGIRKINIPCYNMVQCGKAISLVNQYKGRLDICFSAGIGPRSVDEFNNRNRKRLELMFRLEACSSVGLIGIDLRPETLRFCRKDTQLRVFEEQIKLACKYQKPVLFTERSATSDVIQMLTKYSHKLPPCALYCKYDETHDHPGIRSRYIDMGCYIVIGACVEETHFSLSPGLLRCIENEQIPTDRILISSDSPGVQKFMLPIACHVPTDDNISRCFLRDSVYDLIGISECGTRLDPTVIYLTTDLLANALGRQVDDKDFTRTIYDNTLKFFRMEQYRDRRENVRPSCLRSVQTFLSSYSGQARELLIVPMVVFIVLLGFVYVSLINEC